MQIMLRIIVFIFVAVSFACSDNDAISHDCSMRATIRDLSGLDGCGFVFELENGDRLQPVMKFFCGTQPLPKEMTEDPLYNFSFEDGKVVFISWLPADDHASACMAAELVEITCISEATPQSSD
jgi:hypothetical protein